MKKDNLKENKTGSKAVTVIVSSVLIMGLAGGCAWYLNKDKLLPEKAEPTAAVTSVSSSVSVTEAVTSEETAAAETTSVNTEAQKPEFIYINSPAHIFGRVNTAKGDLNMRKTPSSSSDISGKLKKDTLVYIVSKEGNWYKIESAEGEFSYVSADYILISEYTGSWKEKYRKLSSDISEYITESFGNSGSTGFYLTDFDNDTIPELVYSFRSDSEDGPCFLQIFSADSSSLHADKRRYGTIEKILDDGGTKELLVSRDFRGEFSTAISFDEGKISEKTFIHTNFSYQQQNSPDLYLINGENVSEAEYFENLNRRNDSSENLMLDHRMLLKRLDDYPDESAGTESTETVFCPENTGNESTELIGFGTQPASYYGMIISDSSEVPLFYDSKGRKLSTHEKSGTIVEITGSENGMYSILYRPEGKNPAPETLYINASYIAVNTSASSWQKKYDETVRLIENSNGDRQSTSYMLADINSDGIPELICSITAASSDIKYTHIYTVYNGELYSFSFSGSRASVTFYPETEYIGISGTEGDEAETVIGLKQGTFKTEHTLVYRISTGEEEDEYLVDGETVTEKGYYDTRILFLGGSSEYNEETEEYEYTDPEKEYCRLSAAEVLSEISGYGQ